MMLTAVLSGFVLAALAPWLFRGLGARTGWVLALLPAALLAWFASFVPSVAGGEVHVLQHAWVPSLGLQLSFLVDGLSLLFALLISLIGTFIVIYGGGYLAGHRDLPRFYVLILSFMASMLGLVLSNNLITLFVFWELTSITSYLLIGFNHEDKEARRCALQGLLVTVTGGLALLVGLVMMGLIAGSFELSEILASGELFRDHALYMPILLLVLAGAFTKSAQVPFHFWLPNAMAAPTPVSAYLHSATMVKAGVYLMARLNPTMGGTEAWFLILGLVGALTMLTGVWMAYRSTGIKRVLAYSTVMALGTLTMLIGMGGEKAAMAAVTFLLAHALYKGALFMVAGAIDHETGTKDLEQLGGLRRKMPVTAVVAVVAGLSLAGLPPLFGFVAKELLLEAVLARPGPGWILAGLVVLSSMLVVAVAAIVVLKPFFGALREPPRHPHEAPPSMLLGPAILASLGLGFGLLPWLAGQGLLAAAASAVYGHPVNISLSLWHGVNLPLILSALILIAGILLYFKWPRLRDWFNGPVALDQYGPEALYYRFTGALSNFAGWQTRVLQNGYMRNYLLTILLTTVAVVGYTLFSRLGWGWLPSGELDVRFYELVVAGGIIVAAVGAAVMRSKLAAVAAMGVVGFAVALIYVLFSAPDLGITQVLVETLTVILLVLALFKLPNFSRLSSRMSRLRDVTVGVAFGGLMAALMFSTLGVQFEPSISAWFLESAYTEAQGRNVVNVILVDFRALDTLGEIYVLALAAIGVYAMMKFRSQPAEGRS